MKQNKNDEALVEEVGKAWSLCQKSAHTFESAIKSIGLDINDVLFDLFKIALTPIQPKPDNSELVAEIEHIEKIFVDESYSSIDITNEAMPIIRKIKAALTATTTEEK